MSDRIPVRHIVSHNNSFSKYCEKSIIQLIWFCKGGIKWVLRGKLIKLNLKVK